MRKILAIILITIIGILIGWFANELNQFAEGMKNDRAPQIQTIPNWSYRPIVIPKNNKIRLGEEYIADVRMTAIDINHPPIVILGKLDSLDFTPSGDTLEFDPKSEASVFKIIPKSTGIFSFDGQVLYNLGVTQKYFFHAEYTVTK